MLTQKQVGDACEMLVAARLTIAGNPTIIMPDGWPDYDLIVQPPNQQPQRISVKARSQSTRGGSTHSFHFCPDGCDWIAFVFLPEAGDERIWIVPAHVAGELSSSDGNGRKLRLADLEKGLAAWKGNFPLQRNPPEIGDHKFALS